MSRLATPAIDRFWSHTDKRAPDECWPWIGGLRQGYGRLRDGDRRLFAYRFSYESFVGPIPAGLTLDHLCRNRACVNPTHLEPVTNGVNVLRGESPSAVNARKTHCVRGHRLSEDNVSKRRNPLNRHRRCLACHRMHETARWRRIKAMAS